MVLDPGAHRRAHERRPQPLHRGYRHAVASDPERETRLAPAEVEAAGNRHADFGIAEFALLDRDALLVGVDPQVKLQAVENERVGIVDGGGKHHRTARDLHTPGSAAL